VILSPRFGTKTYSGHGGGQGALDKKNNVFLIPFSPLVVMLDTTKKAAAAASRMTILDNRKKSREAITELVEPKGVLEPDVTCSVDREMIIK